MITARRIAAVGMTGVAAPLASAADTADADKANPVMMLDSLTVSDIPEEHKAASAESPVQRAVCRTGLSAEVRDGR